MANDLFGRCGCVMSARRRFCPGRQPRGFIVLREHYLSSLIAVSTLRHLTQYIRIETQHIVHIVIPGSHSGHTFYNVSFLRPATASCQESRTHPSAGDGFKLPCRRNYLHASTPVSITLSFSLTQGRPRLCPGLLFNLPSFGNTVILHPCPLFHSIESISCKPCVSHSTLLSFSSHLRKFS